MTDLLLAPCRRWSEQITDASIPEFAPFEYDERVHDDSCMVKGCNEPIKLGTHGWLCTQHYDELKRRQYRKKRPQK